LGAHLDLTTERLTDQAGQSLDEGVLDTDRRDPEKIGNAFSAARWRYSTSISTRVSECSETKAIGTTTSGTPSAPARSISASVEGPIHSSGPTRL